MISARHLLVLAAAFLLSQTASADEHHPIMTSKYWVNLGVFFAARDFSASANGGDKIDFSPGVGK